MLILDNDFEIFQVSERQEKASSKRYSLCRGSPSGKPVCTNPTRIARDRASAMRSDSAKVVTIFKIYNVLCEKLRIFFGLWWCARPQGGHAR